MEETHDSICIKSAETDEELCGRGYVHCTSWQEAYRGIVCDRYLDTMTVEANNGTRAAVPGKYADREGSGESRRICGIRSIER